MSEETERTHVIRVKTTLVNIMMNKDTMDCGEILNALAGLGWDAALLYDDNGHWGMSSRGSASISPEPEDWEGVYFVEKRNWKKSPREAIIAAIERKLEEEE